MSESPNKLIRFWQELKRRKVFGVVTTYAATAYIIIEVANNLAIPLHLPDWFITLILIILLIGLPIVVIMSWIFDFTPQGIKKTESVEESEGKEIIAKPVKRRLRPSYILNAILLIVVVVLAYPKIFNRDKLANLRSADGRISVVVMPFKNLAVDTMFNIWQLGLQNLLITSLSNSEELSVRQYETMDKILGDTGHTNYASLTPSFAADVALKLDANAIVIGNIYKTGNRIRVTANLMDSRKEEIYKSYEVDGDTEDDFFSITDSLSKLIKNYLEIKKLKQKYPVYDLKNVYTSSAEAFKYYIQGRIYHSQVDYNSAIDLYFRSVNNDTNFVSPMLMLSYACGDIGKSEESKMWAYKAYKRISKMPLDIQLQIKEVKAAVDKNPDEQIKYLKQYLEFNPYAPIKLYTLGWVYFNTDQWQDAIDAFEKGIQLIEQFSGKHKLWIWNYLYLGNAYHKVGKHKKEIKIYKDGLDLWPNEELQIINYHAICALFQGDTIKAYELLTKFRAISKKKNYSNSNIESAIGLIYQEATLLKKAQQHYQLAIKSEPADIYSIWAMYYLAYLLIDNDINIGEGMNLIDSALKTNQLNEELLANIYETKGWGLYKQGNYKQALEDLKKGWDLRPYYNHKHYLHLEAAKKAVANQKNN